jgi:hypothetical protein
MNRWPYSSDNLSIPEIADSLGVPSILLDATWVAVLMEVTCCAALVQTSQSWISPATHKKFNMSSAKTDRFADKHHHSPLAVVINYNNVITNP